MLKYKYNLIENYSILFRRRVVYPMLVECDQKPMKADNINLYGNDNTSIITLGNFALNTRRKRDKGG